MADSAQAFHPVIDVTNFVQIRFVDRLRAECLQPEIQVTPACVVDEGFGVGLVGLMSEQQGDHVSLAVQFDHSHIAGPMVEHLDLVALLGKAFAHGL
ncbi:hypothetical protein D3C85_943820 [compost metagenome]